MIRYPVTLAPDDNDTILVTFPDFPEAHTFGEDEAEALARAVDALETIIDAYIRDRRDLPSPSHVTGRRSVTLPSLVATKVQLYNAMRQQQMSKSELARKLHVHLPQVDRLLDVTHGSKFDQLDAAAHALGGYFDIVLVGPEGRQPRAVRARVAPARSASAFESVRRRREPSRVYGGKRSGSARGKKK